MFVLGIDTCFMECFYSNPQEKKRGMNKIASNFEGRHNHPN